LKLSILCDYSYMKNNNKRKQMNNFKKIGLTALAGSLVAISAQAAEMTVSGATMLTYTSEDGTEVTGNPLGMKTNIGFTASGEVNGYNVSYMQTTKDQFAGMSSARLSIDLGDIGTFAFDQGSGSGLATIDDKTPTAAEEIWDGLDSTTAGRVGAAGSSGVVNYVNTFEGVTLNAAFRKGSGTSNSDGASSNAGQGAYDFALTADGSSMGVDGLAAGLGYGEAENGSGASTTYGDAEHMTAFANYSVGPVTFGYQMSYIEANIVGTDDQEVDAWGLAFNVNENLSLSYGERDVVFKGAGTSADVTEKGDGIAVAYTMGSMKIAGNMNDVSDSAGVAGTNDSMTEIAVSFAF
jgi:outer membrane protein OmpU